jgi:hypothetical protein
MFSINTECKDSVRGKYSELVCLLLYCQCYIFYVFTLLCYWLHAILRVKYTYFIDEMQPNYLFENEVYPG